MEKRIGQFISSILMNLGIWCFSRFYSQVDIYAPKNKNDSVMGITFSNDEGFIDYVSKYEKK